MKNGFITIILLLLVAVHGYESLPFGYPSSDFPLSEFDFAQDSDSTNYLSFQPQHLAQEQHPNPEKTFPSWDFGDFQTSENTFLPTEFGFSLDQFPRETMSDSDKTSLSVETDDINVPIDVQQIPKETDLHSDILSIPKSPPPSPVPPTAPVPAKAPSSPKPPLIIETICRRNCSAKCSSKKISILLNLCNKVCTGRCMDIYWQAIYNCTNRCAKSMPEVLKSDLKKKEAYVRCCLAKCTKKYVK